VRSGPAAAHPLRRDHPTAACRPGRGVCLSPRGCWARPGARLAGWTATVARAAAAQQRASRQSAPLCPLRPADAETRPSSYRPKAFVSFENPEEARRACQKDRETFSEKWGDRYVRVYPTLESDVTDMQQAVLQQNMVHTAVRGPARLGGGQCLADRCSGASCAHDARRSPSWRSAFEPLTAAPPCLCASLPGRPLAPHGQRGQDEEPAL
jgi:hypothetical protein